MKVIKENLLLFIWWAVAYVIAFSAFNHTSGLSCSRSIEKPDSLVFFTFTSLQKEHLKQYFEAKNVFNGFNGVVLVGQRDSVFYFQPFGYADYKSRDSLNINSDFQLASVSKQFTAVAILQLCQHNKIKLSDSLQKFYPDFPYQGITIHQLLTHRSGLPNYLYFFQHIPTTCDTLIINQDVVKEMINKQPKAYYRPNQRYHYSNTGYALLAAIVEKVSGLSFNEYLHQNIFGPLHMDSTHTFMDLIQGSSRNNTEGYLYRWRLAEDNYLDGVLGDKGIYTTANDLFKWDQGLYKGLIIDTTWLNKAFQPMGKPLNYSSNYGYGWRIIHWNDTIKVLYHAGWWHGYKSLLMRIPADSTTIIVLKNRSKGGSVSSRQLLRILYPDNITVTDTTEVEYEE